jgi:hypothetical protein
MALAREMSQEIGISHGWMILMIIYDSTVAGTWQSDDFFHGNKSK